MQSYFYELSDALQAQLHSHEAFAATFDGEDTQYVRFNKSSVRQAGSVSQRRVEVDLIDGKRRAVSSFEVSGDRELDLARVARQLGVLRELITVSPDDPFLLYPKEPRSSEQTGPNSLPELDQVMNAVQRIGAGRDLVGLLALGGMYAGFSNSMGQRNWHASHSYHFGFSYYLRADKAVQTSYAGVLWDDAELDRKAGFAAHQLSALTRPPRTVEPGTYRVYLAPEALQELIFVVARGVGLRSHRTKTTPLLRMIHDGATLHPSFTMSENTAEGVAPNFQERGFIKPSKVTLIEHGRYRDALVSPHSAVEYGVACNGASGMEMPESVDVAAGTLPNAKVLSELQRGIFVSNLHYLSMSDRSACRTTGLTRFATFWVENGAIAAPLNVMRFDETIYRVLGDNLVGLTVERDLLLSAATYGGRSSHSVRLPGALINDFTFTL